MQNNEGCSRNTLFQMEPDNPTFCNPTLMEINNNSSSSDLVIEEFNTKSDKNHHRSPTNMFDKPGISNKAEISPTAETPPLRFEPEILAEKINVYERYLLNDQGRKDVTCNKSSVSHRGFCSSRPLTEQTEFQACTRPGTPKDQSLHPSNTLFDQDDQSIVFEYSKK